MMGLGISRLLTHEDHKCKSIAQADFFARRLIAEARRHGWSLTYTVAGHTTIGTSGQRVVWSPNTTVQVDDDELDIHGVFYIEGVRFTRGPQTLTELHLMRPADMLFATDPPDDVPGVYTDPVSAARSAQLFSDAVVAALESAGRAVSRGGRSL